MPVETERPLPLERARTHGSLTQREQPAAQELEIVFAHFVGDR
jgi:hypothetical protein